MAEPRSFDFVIAGNNIAALVTAQALSEKFRIALLNPTPVWGAHFGGSVINGERYDLGMNFMEFTSFNEKSTDVTTYNTNVKNDCGRFLPLVETFVKSLIDVNEIPTPEMLLSGMYLKDAVVANNFEDLYKLPAELKQKIIGELEALVVTKTPLHASNKKLNEKLFIETNYKIVSLANHGETFHALFIEPLCQKILNISSDQMPALFHRIAWAPLLYPETLLAFLKNNSSAFPETLFHYPESGYFGSLAEKLLDKVKSRNNVTILNDKISAIKEGEKFQIDLVNGESIVADKLVWGMDLAQYLKLRDNIDSEPFDKTSIAIAFLNVASDKIKKKISALNLLDTDYSIYRITNQTYSAGQEMDNSKVVVEINYGYHLKDNPGATEADLASYTIRILKELNLIVEKDSIRNITVKILPNVLNLPTLNNFNKFTSMQGKVDGRGNKNLLLVAQSSGYVTTSLNDQIVQGLKIGELYN